MSESRSGVLDDACGGGGARAGLWHGWLLFALLLWTGSAAAAPSFQWPLAPSTSPPTVTQDYGCRGSATLRGSVNDACYSDRRSAARFGTAGWQHSPVVQTMGLRGSTAVPPQSSAITSPYPGLLLAFLRWIGAGGREDECRVSPIQRALCMRAGL